MPFVANDEAAFDCLECGRCCYQREGTILVTESDLLRWHRQKRFDILDGIGPGHFSQEAFHTQTSGACIHHGLPGKPHACDIYETRGEVCRSFEVGSQQCLEARRTLPTQR
jgi:Fe-S-cluster containining protein